MSETVGTVVLVDDEGELRAMLRTVLVRRDLAVHDFADAESTLAAIDGGVVTEIDLFVIDAGLPGVSGIALARAIEQRLPGAGGRTVIITGHDPGPDLLDLSEELNVRVMWKPFRIDAFLEVCDRVVRERP